MLHTIRKNDDTLLLIEIPLLHLTNEIQASIKIKCVYRHSYLRNSFIMTMKLCKRNRPSNRNDLTTTQAKHRRPPFNFMSFSTEIKTYNILQILI